MRFFGIFSRLTYVTVAELMRVQAAHGAGVVFGPGRTKLSAKLRFYGAARLTKSERAAEAKAALAA